MNGSLNHWFQTWINSVMKQLCVFLRDAQQFNCGFVWN